MCINHCRLNDDFQEPNLGKQIDSHPILINAGATLVRQATHHRRTKTFLNRNTIFVSHKLQRWKNAKRKSPEEK
jgi:hypothetical protein